MGYVFLDRDGVINEDRADYVKDWSEFTFIPGSLKALRLLTEAGFRIVVITNQSIINRGLVTPQGLDTIFSLMKEAVRSHGGHIEAIFHCPHTPEDQCNCRKPKPGLLYQARTRYGLDLGTVPMIGDSLKDLQCARSAGCSQAILVRTGYGRETEALGYQQGIIPDFIAEDLLGAVMWLLSGKTHGVSSLS